MKQFLTILAAFLLMCVGTYAQTDSLRLRYVYEGTVRDATTGKVLQYVGVSIPGRPFATVTNVDGDFIIKSDESASELTFSMIGYKSLTLPVPDEPGARMRISMAPQSLTLHEAMIISADPYSLVEEATKRIPLNYSLAPELLKSFYRETVQKRQKYVYISEAVSDIYKTSYAEDIWRDNVSIDKSRVLLSQRRSDTLSIKMMGGPTEPLLLDVVKNPEVLLDENIDRYYVASLGSTAYIDDRPQFVVELRPAEKTDFALYYGTLYIDMQTMAFTRAELSLDMSDKAAATRLILIKKPLGLRFTPKKVALTINYGSSGGRYRMSYFRSEIQFNCDWKKRLIATSYSVVNELVITDLRADVQPISRADMFKSSDILSEKSAEFSDPDFWDAYNIIEPSESLEHAIGKLKKH
jgi:hypothetical protein